jgi:hypothetical protein
MTLERSAFLKTVVLVCAALLVSGCASMVYSPANRELNDPDASGCDRQALEDALVKSCRRLGEGSPVKTAPPFFAVARHTAVADPYKLSEKPPLLSQFLFEFTPLGFFAPIFDYPPRETVYTGRVELSISPAEAALGAASKFDFRVNAGETFTKLLEFDKARYAPDSATISIRCRSRGCELSSIPPVVKPDGSLRLQPR